MCIPCGKTFPLVPRSSVGVKVKFKGHIFKKWPLQGTSHHTSISQTPPVTVSIGMILLNRNENTVKPVLETTCIKRPSALRDHNSDKTTFHEST